MFRRKTVFILGAGASAEFNLPIGSALAERIHKMMDVRFRHLTQFIGDGDEELFESLKRRLGYKSDQWLRAFWRIRDGILFSNSIDDFLDRHQQDAVMLLAGKAAIAKTIAEAEQKSVLMPGNHQSRFDPLRAKDTWLLRLVRMMGASVSSQEVFNNVSFISFNYDRCLEHFLWQAIPNLYAVPNNDVAEIMRPLKVFHPYGSIAPLPVTDQPDTVPFGGDLSDYVSIAKRIHTYTEQISDGDEMVEMHRAIAEAEQLVFLGFGFHSQNMALLTPDQLLGEKLVYATTFGLSGPNAEVVKNRIAELFLANIRSHIKADNLRLHDLTSAKLLDEYRIALTA